MPFTQPPPKLAMRKGITDPVVLLISRRQVEQNDMASVLASLKLFTASKEDAWLYRGQITLTVDGYNNDPREIVDIPEARAFLKSLSKTWKHWAFFLNQVDDSIKLLTACACGDSFPGRGAVVMDAAKLPAFLQFAFDGMNELFDKHGFPESENEAMSQGLIAIVLDPGE
jgi:hypothetical protein